MVRRVQREEHTGKLKKKSWSEVNAFYVLKLLPLSTATAGGQPPACLPVQPYTLGLKSPDAAQ